MKTNNPNNSKVHPRFNDSAFRHSFSDLDHKMCQLGECVASKFLHLSTDDLDRITNHLNDVILFVELLNPISDETED